MDSAPPTLAPKAASVLRSTLNQGSSRLNIRRPVTACVLGAAELFGDAARLADRAPIHGAGAQ